MRILILLLAFTCMGYSMQQHDIEIGYVFYPQNLYHEETKGIDSTTGTYSEYVLDIFEKDDGDLIKKIEGGLVVHYDHFGLSGQYAKDEDITLSIVNHGYRVNFNITENRAIASIPLHRLNFYCDYKDSGDLAIFISLVLSFIPNNR